MADAKMHAELRLKTVNQLKKLKGDAKGIIYVQGGSEIGHYDQDTQYTFKQESNFLYLTGCDQPDFAAIISLDDASCILLAPKLPEEYGVWLGGIPTLEELKKTWGPEKCEFSTDANLEKILADLAPKEIFVLDSVKVTNKLIEKYSINNELLIKAVHESRVTKTELELVKMRKSSDIASRAHIELMKALKPGMNEADMDALFTMLVRKESCKHVAYGSIMAGGKRGATLHYMDNDKDIPDGCLFLTDAGPTFEGYASDITRTFPANGKFTEEQKAIYNAVLKAQCDVIDMLKPGIEYIECHKLAQRVFAEELLKIGIFQNGTVDELMEHHVPAVLFPHGLGHFMGLDVHDCAGWAEGAVRSTEPGTKYLRMNRVLAKGQVLTVEPGLYFIDMLLDEAKADDKISKYFNWDMVERYKVVGGIRIEDDLIITDDGYENMTTTPKTVEDVEALMKA